MDRVKTGPAAGSTGAHLNRRQTIALATAALAGGYGGSVCAQEADDSEPFTFEALADRMRKLSQTVYEPPEPAEGFLADLTYDDYRHIQFRPDHTPWSGDDMPFHLHAYHLGWLFKEPVSLFEIVDGRAHPLHFTTDDFRYQEGLSVDVPEHADMPGVAGFRINAPLNSDRYDEVVSFLGASYFRALGKDNLYGLSARGLAVNTATDAPEEFPRFTAYWLEHPSPGSDQVVFYAALESASVTGAYRFVLVPGQNTRIDVTARLFFREDIRQLGIAPLTSMFLFGPNDEGPFDDYRRAVHDSELLVMNAGGSNFARPLRNPPRLANSYLGASNPISFGLVQRNRSFDDFLDAGAHYERRPSLMVEPVGNWGKGMVRLIEIPTDLETNDNIVAYWAPDKAPRAGEEMEVSYRLHWGSTPPGSHPKTAQVVRTLVGKGGIAGTKADNGRQKFVIDFEGGPLMELSADSEVVGQVQVSGGELTENVVARIEGTGMWRLVFEVDAESGATVEMRATLMEGDRRLSEIWLYQWMKE